MAIVLNLKPKLHRLQAEACSIVPAVNAGGSFVEEITVPAYNTDLAAFCVNTTSAVWLYNFKQDSYLNLPTGGIGGTFGAGSCGTWVPLGPTGTATAGSTTTITTNLTIPRDLRGYIIRITGGPGAGDERVIKSNTLGANSVITVNTAFSTTITTASTYRLITPRLWIVNPSTGLGYFDWALSAWTTGLSTTGLTNTGTDGLLKSTNGILGNDYDWSGALHTWNAATSATLGINNVAYTVNQWQYGFITIVDGTGAGQTRMIASNTAATAGVSTLTVASNWSVTPDATSVWILGKAFDSGGAAGTGGRAVFSSATNTTNAVLTVTGTNWAANQWANSCQLRCIAGTNVGQFLPISANTATTVTLVGVFTSTLDATSVWVIEGNDNSLYFMGNQQIGVFRYSISGNSWSTVGATAARAAAPGTGASFVWVNSVMDSAWTNPDLIKNGRYFYSFRGNNRNVLDYYDIAAGTWTSGLAYGNQGELFTTGTCYAYDYANRLFIAQSSGRILYYDILRNSLEPYFQINYAQGTATVGDKLFITWIFEGSTVIPVLYHWRNTGQELFRVLAWTSPSNYPTFP